MNLFDKIYLSLKVKISEGCKIVHYNYCKFNQSYSKINHIILKTVTFKIMKCKKYLTSYSDYKTIAQFFLPINKINFTLCTYLYMSLSIP